MFLVKGGTVDVLIAAHRAARPVEREPITFESLRTASTFTLERFTAGCRRLFKPYLSIGLTLMAVYALSGAAYLAFVVYGYRAATDRFLVVGWTFVAALSAALLVAWITLVNLLYLLMQIAIAVDGGTAANAPMAVLRFIRAEFRELAAVFGVVLALVVVATLASALAWSGVGLIAFVPLVGLAVFPLQLAALARPRSGVRVSRADGARRLRDAVPSIRTKTGIAPRNRSAVDPHSLRFWNGRRDGIQKRRLPGVRQGRRATERRIELPHEQRRRRALRDVARHDENLRRSQRRPGRAVRRSGQLTGAGHLAGRLTRPSCCRREASAGCR